MCAALLQVLIEEHNNMYVQLFKMKLKPKASRDTLSKNNESMWSFSASVVYEIRG